VAARMAVIGIVSIEVDVVGGGLHVVHDVVESAGEPVDVLAVERCDERGVEAADDLVGHIVTAVLHVLQLPGLLVAVVTGVDYLGEQPRTFDEVARRLAEEVVERRVRWQDVESHGSPCLKAGQNHRRSSRRSDRRSRSGWP
jgi:hypothetical protein